MKIQTNYAGLNAFQLEPERLAQQFPLTCMLMAGMFEQFKEKNAVLLNDLNTQMEILQNKYCIMDEKGNPLVKAGTNGRPELVFNDNQQHREFDEAMAELMKTDCIVII